MLCKPMPFQVTGAAWLAAHGDSFLADDMGLGKTAQVILAADAVGAMSILVVCPANVRVNWMREFNRFSPLDRPCTLIQTGKDAVPKDACGVVVCSYDLLQAHAHVFRAREWDLLVLDEAHYLKERTTRRTKAIYGHAGRPGLTGKAKRTWRLSGTPAPNDVSEMFPHLKSAGVVTESYWDFVFRYCTGFNSDWGFKITGHQNVAELKQRMSEFMLRRLKKDVMPDMPPLQISEVTVERSAATLPTGQRAMDAAVVAEIRVGEQTLAAALAAVDGAPKDQLAILESQAGSYSTLRRFIGVAKAPACLDLIEEELEAGAYDKIVLFAIHRDVVALAQTRLAKFGAVSLNGDTPTKKRQENIDRFVTDPQCRVFVGNVKAAGTGVDGLQKACCEVAFLEQSWVPAENEQAIMRVHRNLQTRPVRARMFSLYGSVDEQVQKALTQKIRELAKIF